MVRMAANNVLCSQQVGLRSRKMVQPVQPTDPCPWSWAQPVSRANVLTVAIQATNNLSAECGRPVKAPLVKCSLFEIFNVKFLGHNNNNFG